MTNPGTKGSSLGQTVGISVSFPQLAIFVVCAVYTNIFLGSAGISQCALVIHFQLSTIGLCVNQLNY